MYCSTSLEHIKLETCTVQHFGAQQTRNMYSTTLWHIKLETLTVKNIEHYIKNMYSTVNKCLKGTNVNHE